MKLLVKNGDVVLQSGVAAVDIVCESGRIASLIERGTAAQADETVDASGRIVFPGFIDPHVHSRDPGLTEKEDFAHSTLGALCGGVTCILEMPNAVPPVIDVATLDARIRHLAPQAWVDFGLWGMSLGEENLAEIGALMRAGVVAIKLFWGYGLRKDTRQLVYNLTDESAADVVAPPDHGQILEVFRAVAQSGGLLAAHCEDREMLEHAERVLQHPPVTYDDLLKVRSDTAEAVTMAIGAQFAKATGCRFHVVHLASAAGVGVLRQAQEAGVHMTAETCPQYLTFTDRDFNAPADPVKVYPPIRGSTDQAALWQAVLDGTISTVGSDHAPHTLREKMQPLGAQPAGVVGVETLAPVMLNELSRGRMSAELLAQRLSTATAQLYGLYPRKGVIRVGSDADLTIVDPTRQQTIDNAELHAKNPLSPWHGQTLEGTPVLTVLRGNVVMRDNEPVGDRTGQFVGAAHGQISSAHSDALTAGATEHDKEP